MKKIKNKIYFAASYQKREEFIDLYKYLLSIGVEVSAPIYQYHVDDDIDYKKLMNYAFKEINSSNILMAETTYKEIGIGIEIGYAKANNIPIIYLRKKGSELSTTVLGTSDEEIVYSKKDLLPIGDKIKSLIMLKY